MNILEHYIKEILEERPLNEEEIKDFKLNGLDAENYVFVKWVYNCYGSIQTTECYYIKGFWEEAKKNGYVLM